MPRETDAGVSRVVAASHPATPGNVGHEPDAFISGRVSALAAESQRDLMAFAEEFSGLFPPKPFDGSVFATLALANAFAAPDLRPDDLRSANRTSLWAFRLDWEMDTRTSSSRRAAEIATRCRAIGAGRDASDRDLLGQMLARIRDDMSRLPSFDLLGAVWRTELDRVLDAMTREVGWRLGDHALPTVDEYVNNADNLGSSFVHVSHWLSNLAAVQLDDVPAVLTATRAAQRIIRLVNDRATLRRDEHWGDLNALMLGLTARGLMQRIDRLTSDFELGLASLAPRQPRLALFLRRQVDFCRGFYGLTDYWGRS
jgi:hypothetical protein